MLNVHKYQEVKAASKNPSSLPSSNSEAEAAFPDLGLAFHLSTVNWLGLAAFHLFAKSGVKENMHRVKVKKSRQGK